MNIILKISTTSFFLLIGLYALGQCNCSNKSDLVEIKSVGDSISIINSKKTLSKLNGFPLIDCTFRDGCCEFPKDRFLAISESGNYLVIDNSLNEIIPPSDSIIAFSYWSQDSVVDYTCYPDYRGKMKLFYQAIRGGLTYLYNYHGKLVTTTPYRGEIYDVSYNLDFNRSFWITINCHCDSLKMGLIDSTGRSVAEQVLTSNRLIGQFDQYYDNLWNFRDYSTNETKLINVSTEETLLIYDEENSSKYEYGILVFKRNGKYGIFHPSKGILVQPKYDLIKPVDNKSDTYILMKRKKKSEWIVSEETKDNYTQRHAKMY